ncbi:hypothetical protein D3C80_2147060 [compost metagenome]
MEGFVTFIEIFFGGYTFIHAPEVEALKEVVHKLIPQVDQLLERSLGLDVALLG